MWDRNACFSCTRSILSNLEWAKAKELHSFTTVSSVIWMTPSDRQGPDAARQWISLLSHLSEVDFQEVRVIHSWDKGTVYAQGKRMASSDRVSKTTRQH